MVMALVVVMSSWYGWVAGVVQAEKKVKSIMETEQGWRLHNPAAVSSNRLSIGTRPRFFHGLGLSYILYSFNIPHHITYMPIQETQFHFAVF